MSIYLGCPAKLSHENFSTIKSILEEDDPKACGYSVWDGSALSDYIKKTYSVNLCVGKCRRIFHDLGFSLVRPRTFPSKNKAGLAGEWDSFKKTDRTGGRQFSRHSISGRGAFLSDNICYKEMGIKKVQSQNWFCSRQEECAIQQICDSFNRGAVPE